MTGRLLFLFCALPAAALPAAQSPAPASIVLPPKLVAEQPATLAVLDASGALLPGAVVEFAGGERVTTDRTGRAVFTVPALAPPMQTGVLRAQVSGATSVADSAIVLPPSAASEVLALRDPPMVIALSDRFVLSGTGFHGIADRMSVFLRDEPALLLASSPVALVVLAGPRTAPGAAELVVEVEGRRSAPQSLTLVALEISAERATLAPKQKGALTVRVRGTEQRLELEARNLTPEVVKLAGGETQRLLTSGGPENSAVLALEGRRAGEFSVSVRLIPAVAGLPNTEAARQKLLAAKRLAPAASRELNWSRRLDRIIEQLQRSPQNALAARTELEKLLALQPRGEFGALIEDAWRILLHLP